MKDMVETIADLVRGGSDICDAIFSVANDWDYPLCDDFYVELEELVQEELANDS